MQRLICYALLFAIMLVLSSCTPTLYVRLFNATAELITIGSTQSKEGTRIAPGTAADFSMFAPPNRLFICSSKHSWSYSMLDFYQPRWPLALWQQHAGVMRPYRRIVSAGRICALAPPVAGHLPREISQPAGFPIRPKT